MASAADKETKDAFKTIIDSFRTEEATARNETVKDILKHEAMWFGNHYSFWDSGANIWRSAKDGAKAGLIRDADILDYDKYIGTFRAHGKAVIAASSIEFPKYTFQAEDFNSPNDILTADVFAKIGQIIQHQNDGRRLFARAFYVRWNQHFIAIYNYHEFDERFGEESVEVEEPYKETVQTAVCPECQIKLPELSEVCAGCGADAANPQMVEEIVESTRKVLQVQPKGREILEVYGPKNVMIPRSAQRQEDCPYLIFEKDYHKTKVMEYLDSLDLSNNADITSFGDGNEEEAMRMPHPYTPTDNGGNILVSQAWLRPEAYWELGLRRKTDVKKLKKQYPKGARVVLLNHEPVLCIKESLDDHWTLSISATGDSIHDDPLGKDLIPINQMEDESLQLALETLKQAISELFADPNVLNFKAYAQTEKMPGTVTPAEAKPGFGLDSAFFETRPASLSKEHDVFVSRLQSIGQLVVHAFPSVFGGTNNGGGGTYAEYAKSSQQALQVLGLDYQPIVDAFGKAIKKSVVSFIANMQRDTTSYSYKAAGGKQVDILIDKAKTMGRVGDVSTENSAQLPTSWAELRAFLIELVTGNNPQILATIFHPQNTTFTKALLGMQDLFVPGESDHKKQLLELDDLLNQAPQPMLPPTPPMTGDPMMDGIQPEPQMPEMGMGMQPPMPQQPTMQSSVTVLDSDNHQIHIDAINAWDVSENGQWHRLNNPDGYQNVMMHRDWHQQKLMQAQMPAPVPGAGGVTKPGFTPEPGGPMAGNTEEQVH